MTGLVLQLGPLGLLLLMIPESACVPIPSEVTLMTAGFAVHQGWMAFWVSIAAATAGNLLGSLLAYLIGRSTARTSRSSWTGRALERGGAAIERHGTRAIFLARLMPLARTFVSLPAGRLRVPLMPFVVLTALGCALWSVAFVSLGDVLGEGWRAGTATVGPPLLIAGVAVCAAATLKAKRATGRAE